MLSIERAIFAAVEFRSTAAAEDASVKVRDPLAQELIFQSLVQTETDANTLRDEILALRKISRNDWTCSVRNKQSYSTLQVGQTITLDYPRFGFSGGKNFIIKRIAKDQVSRQINLTLFGPQ